MGLAVSYSHAAPYIREAIFTAAGRKLEATTIRRRREHVGEMFGLVRALDILLDAPEGADSPAGMPEYRGVDYAAVAAEVERFVGGPERMAALGFVDIEDLRASAHLD